MKTVCAYCGKKCEKSLGHYNRAMKMGCKVYCDKKCAGLGRRCGRTKEQDLQIKYFYDALRALSDVADSKRKRHEWFRNDYAANPEKYKAERKKRYQQHLKYLSTEKYKKYKHDYDQIYCSKKQYGKFWEAAIALRNLRGIVDNRRAKQDQKSINKQQNRKRYANKNTKRKELESCSVGIYQPC